MLRPAKSVLWAHVAAVASVALGFAAAITIGCARASAEASDAPTEVPNTTGLPSIGTTWVSVNPYRGNAKAIAYGQSLFAQQCARCHGIGAISGGIAPDLRFLPEGAEGDAVFVNRVKNGSARDGRVLMPKMGVILGQEAMWTVRAWLDTVRQD